MNQFNGLVFVLVFSSAFLISPSTKSASKTSEVNADEIRYIPSNGQFIVPLRINGGTGAITYGTVPRSSKADLEEFSPGIFRKTLQEIEEQHKKMQAKAQKNQKRPGVFVKTVKNFPSESATFFIAIGLVMYGHLVFDYANNPIAIEQHFMSLKDPISHLAFFNFMLANHSISDPLMAAYSHSKMRVFIPYLGMSAGMIASHLSHDLFTDKDLQACAISLVKQKSLKEDEIDPCDRSYYNWVLGPNPRVHNYISGMISLIGSTAAAGVITGVTVKTLQFTAVQIGLTLTPGGWVASTGRWLIKVANLAGFTAIDMWLNPRVVARFKNWRYGSDLRGSERALITQLANAKRNNWATETCNIKTQSCRDTFIGELKYMSESLRAWKDMNLEQINMAYVTWLEALAKFTGTYNYAFQFYGHYFNELQTKFKNAQNPTASMIDRSWPLYGVVLKGLPEDRQNLFLEWPEKIEELQQITLKEIASTIKSKLADKSLVAQFEPEDVAQLNEWIGQLNSPLPNTNARALISMKKINNKGKSQGSKSSDAFVDLTRKLFKQAGAPNPRMNVGEGYVAIFGNSPQVKEYSAYAKNEPHLSRMMVKQMICGPDVEKGESNIKDVFGWAPRFHAPQIKLANDDISFYCHYPHIVDTNYIFEVPLSINKKDKMVTYKGAMDYLRSNTRSTPYGKTGESNFVNWWQALLEPQILTAVQEYGEKYKAIIFRLNEKLKDTSDSNQNKGPVANNILTTLTQEQRLYTLILGEIFRDLIKARLKGPIPSQFLAKSIQRYDYSKVARTDVTDNFPVLGLLRHNRNLDLVNMAEAYPNSSLARSFSTKLTPTLLFQEKISFQFDDLVVELRKLEISEKNEQYTLDKNVDLKVLEAKANAIQESLQFVSMVMGITEDQSVALILPTRYQKELIGMLMRGILGATQEVVQIAQIAQAVNYDPRNAPISADGKPCVKFSGLKGPYKADGEQCD